FLRKLQVRDVAELHRLLQRADRQAHRSAVTGARPRQADEARVGDPASARIRRRAADARLAQRILHPVALRAQPRAAPLALQLRPHAGRLARSLTWGAIPGPPSPTTVIEARHGFAAARRALGVWGAISGPP